MYTCMPTCTYTHINYLHTYLFNILHVLSTSTSCMYIYMYVIGDVLVKDPLRVLCGNYWVRGEFTKAIATYVRSTSAALALRTFPEPNNVVEHERERCFYWLVV